MYLVDTSLGVSISQDVAHGRQEEHMNYTSGTIDVLATTVLSFASRLDLSDLSSLADRSLCDSLSIAHFMAVFEFSLQIFLDSSHYYSAIINTINYE